MNSTNSSKPPSSDGYCKPSPKSRRVKSGKKRGKQPGTRGNHLAHVENPDEVINHTPSACSACGKDLTNIEPTETITRQVFELPPLRLNVTEHTAQKKLCTCATENVGTFPVEAKSHASYGPLLKACVCYLSCRQHIPVLRIQELLRDLYNAPISTGTIVNMIDEGASLLGDPLEKIKELLKNSNVVNADESGLNVEALLYWVHALSTNDLTLYNLDKKRGKVAMDNIGIIEYLTGILTHDCWSPYFKFKNVSYSLCNAHLLRELIAVEEIGQLWAPKMIKLLTDTYHLVEEAKLNAKTSLESEQLSKIRKDYKKITNLAHSENPKPEFIKKRGRQKKSKALNLLTRFETYQDEILKFSTDFNVPFDNNLSERDIRMVKVKQKVSGGFRTTKGAEAFLAFRSYLSTASKQGVNQLEALQQLFNGNPWMPSAQPNGP